MLSQCGPLTGGYIERWEKLRSQTQEDWILADEAFKEENVRQADPPYTPQLASWPPYEALKTAAILSRPRLFTESRHQRPRGTVHTKERRQTTPEVGAPGTQHRKPPDERWVGSVLADWLGRMYDDIQAPLEPLLNIVRCMITSDESLPPESKRYSVSLNLPDFKEELLKEMYASLPITMAEVYADAVRRLGDWYEQRNPFRRLMCDSWVWWWHPLPDLILPWNLECYVEQPGPCCAAASTAGAINTVNRWPRPSYCDTAAIAAAPVAGPALSARDSLRVMESELLSMIHKSVAAGGLDLPDLAVESLATKVAQELEPGGELFSPPPTTPAQKVRCMEYIRLLLISALPNKKDAFMRLNLDVNSTQCKGCRYLRSLISDIWGLGKTRCSRPSTARFGSWGVEKAAKKLVQQGRAKGLTAAVQNAADYTWVEFCSLIFRTDCAVVLHLPNHFACVFGVRGDSVLTARKGQPPTDWISWTELRTIYKGLIFVYNPQSFPALKTLSIYPVPTPRPRPTYAISPAVPPKSSVVLPPAVPAPPQSGARRQLELVSSLSSSGAREWKVTLQATPVWADADGAGVLLAELDEGHIITELERTRHSIRHAGGWTRIRAREEEADSESSGMRRRIDVNRARAAAAVSAEHRSTSLR